MKTQRLKRFPLRGTGSAFGNVRHARPNTEHNMKKIREVSDTDEPLGIIISRGDRAEQRPVFAAYIWGPAPEPVVEPVNKVA